MNDDAICQVAPEWWGAGPDDQVNVDMAVWGCPVGDCLERFAAAQGRMYRQADLGPVVVAGLYGSSLFAAVNRLCPEAPATAGPACGTDAGYQRHRRAGEAACDGCLAAHRGYMARWKTRRAA